VAEAYTATDAIQARRRFTDAAARLDRYIREVRDLSVRGYMPPETRDLLVDQATTLQTRLRAETSGT